jgi:two-component system CheB/CheR fusion protein
MMDGERPDLILMDASLPKLDGLATVRRIRENESWRDVPIIFLTGYDIPDFQEAAVAAGCRAWLTKPAGFEELHRLLAQYIPLRKLGHRVMDPDAGFSMTSSQAALAEDRGPGGLEAADGQAPLEGARQQELDRFFTLALDLFCIVGFDGRLRRLNPAWANTLGYGIEELQGCSIFHLLHPEDCQALRAAYQKLESGQPLTRLENRVRRQDGSYVSVSWTYSPLAEAGLAYGVGREITERELEEAARDQLLRQAQSSQAKAEAESRLKDELLAILSHELRNPLTAIIGQADMLLRISRTNRIPFAYRAAETIYRNAIAQSQLISDLFDLSRLQAGKLALNRQAIPLALPITDALESVKAEAEAKQITLEVDLSAVPLIVKVDAVRLQQIVWNLLSNAIKFTQNQGRVTLRLEPQDNQARLMVEDTGAGINPESLPHIFEMFQQVEPYASKRRGGTGIGLALVRQLVELHGGRIEVTSDGAGRGTRFIVYLPLENIKTNQRDTSTRRRKR